MPLSLSMLIVHEGCFLHVPFTLGDLLFSIVLVL